MNGEHKKFSEVEIMLGLFGFGGIDLVCAIIDFTGVGLALTPILQGGGTFASNLWFRFGKGDTQSLNLGRQIAKYGGNFLPVVPFLTVAFFIEVQLHNNQEKLGVVAKAAAVVKKV